MQKATRVFELLKNEHFVEWVNAPSEESDHYWSKWISNHPDRREDVETARRVIQSSRLQSEIKISEEVYDRMLENVVNYSLEKKRNNRGIGFRIWRPLSIAASVTALLLFAAVGYFGIDFNDAVTTQMVEKEAPHGRKISTRLPDGSSVILNSGSRITFPSQFEGDSRAVKLVGEAFFDIEHNPNRPFIVNMNGDQVRVLGTSFNIRAYPEDRLVKVSVATGKVAYMIPGGEEVLLLPDQMASYDQVNETLTTGPVDQLQAFGWKDRIICFKSASFKEIVSELERWYGVEIIVTEDFGQRGTYSGVFKNESLYEVLNGLSFIYRFDFKIERNKVTLKSITS